MKITLVLSSICLLLICIGSSNASKVGPNIIYILLDDVGWADFNYNVDGNITIPTPNIDRLAGEGIKLKRHYVQPTCTPSRASLLTGRYARNTGLTFAMFPGAVSGLPIDMPTMPQLLRKAGYSAHMVGKWHLGHAQWKQTPVGRGFETHTGSFLWDLDSYDKSMWQDMYTFYGLDWIDAHENGTFKHKLNMTHATKMITDTAIEKMDKHNTENPLFLYLSYTAAHSPLQPEPESAAKCTHIPHLWRRQFCGMVVGLDTAIARVTEAAKSKLGDDTVIVVSSDNGGSVWFGGSNQPLRSGKLNAFEGGVKVPAFVHDLSEDRKYIGGKGGKEFNHKMHISDWLPTFLSWSNSKHLLQGIEGIDGIDQSEALRSGESVRDEILLDMYFANESHDQKSMQAYIKGKYKLIVGDIRDPYYYTEPTADHVATTDDHLFPRVLIEKMARLMDYTFGERRAEMYRALFSNLVLFQVYQRRIGPQVMLFDLDTDVREQHNIAESHPDVVSDILATMNKIKAKSPPQADYFYVVANSGEKGFPGDCSGTEIPAEQCQFVHWWVPDDADLSLVERVKGSSLMLGRLVKIVGPVLLVLVLFMIAFMYLMCRCCCIKNHNHKQKLN